ncbi:AhpC-TSA-domain-containing protein [Mycena alexandri]|uniref:thioredoxin-dependent peroxiredoxin n=1 Tax=Mycena alexandri TaxID=1745969 RepID=A0AAD6SDX3_9AGAR|nr:AhpC-TSA-domain-containing protein [Mycena alexandri]KAJ7035987.1 AhpC-TSA-domain-containing protein [Mycena alexandri]
MAPRKAAAESDEAVAPRRSSRAATVKSSTETQIEEDSSSKKRKAADGDKPAKTKKKAKAEDEPEEDGEPAEKLASIDIGDSLPTLTLKNEKDEDVEVSSLTADKGLVLFLVPKADTPGCTTQACGFRDIYPDFTGLDYNVYCLSADTPAAQTKWQTKKELPYPMLSDRKRVLITALGAAEGGKTKRSHFIFEKGGKLLDKKVPVKAGDSPKLALDFVKSL